jgi:hypothetical protein
MLLLQPDTLRASARTASLSRESEAVKQQSPVLMRNKGRCEGIGSVGSGAAGGSETFFEFCRDKMLLGDIGGEEEARSL